MKMKIEKADQKYDISTNIQVETQYITLRQ